jgi:hypothetical protein
MLTIIDFSTHKDNILNLYSLPKDVMDLIDECDLMRTSGFQTLLGYVGRRLRFEALITFNENGSNYFTIDSIGGVNKEGKNIQWKK